MKNKKKIIQKLSTFTETWSRDLSVSTFLEEIEHQMIDLEPMTLALENIFESKVQNCI